MRPRPERPSRRRRAGAALAVAVAVAAAAAGWACTGARSDVPGPDGGAGCEKGWSYLACGCGCCGGAQSPTACADRANWAEVQARIEEDRRLPGSPGCANAGCSLGVRYVCCE